MPCAVPVIMRPGGIAFGPEQSTPCGAGIMEFNGITWSIQTAFVLYWHPKAKRQIIDDNCYDP